LGVSRKVLILYGMNITITSLYIYVFVFSIFPNRLGRESIQANDGLLYLPKNHWTPQNNHQDDDMKRF